MLELVNKTFQLDADLMTYPQFKRIWERDTTEQKEEAYAYISFIFHFYNPKSAFYAYPETTRKEEIIARLFPEHMKTVGSLINDDEDMIKAATIYVDHLQLSPYRSVIDTAKQALQSMSITIKDQDTPIDQKLNYINKITRGMEELKKAEKLCDEDEINSRVKGRRVVRDRERV